MAAADAALRLLSIPEAAARLAGASSLGAVPHKMLKLLRIGAGICLVLAALSLALPLLQHSSFARGGGAVIRKYVSTSGSGSQFRLDCGLDSGGEYNCTYSRRFYDAARVGDHLEFPCHGYTRLVRDGAIIKRDFSDELIFPAVYSLVALLPSLVFIQTNKPPLRRLFYALAGSVEALVIAVTLYGFLAPC